MLLNGCQLQAARALADLTQGELARLCGLSQNTISNLEKKKHTALSGSTVNTLIKIEQTLNAHHVVLIDDNGIGAVRRIT
jgi:transcriptional regulator with XRE-family HTH domain